QGYLPRQRILQLHRLTQIILRPQNLQRHGNSRTSRAFSGVGRSCGAPACERTVSFSACACAQLLRSARSLEMMQRMSVTLEQTGTSMASSRSAFILRFISTVALWTIALLIMFSGHEGLFWLLISVLGMIGLWEFYRMLDHKGLPNFKITGMICGAVLLAGSFFYFSPSSAGRCLHVFVMTSRCKRWPTLCLACCTCFGFSILSPRSFISHPA